MMPLLKKSSKKAFDQNMKAEMESGKPQDQSLAIAYDIQRRNKRKKMAMGGEAMADAPSSHDEMRMMKAKHMFKKMMADGGEVDLDENAMESGNLLDELNEDALDHESYSEASALDHDEPMDSDEHGDKLDSDKMDRIGRMMAKMKSKKRM